MSTLFGVSLPEVAILSESALTPLSKQPSPVAHQTLHALPQPLFPPEIAPIGLHGNFNVMQVSERQWKFIADTMEGSASAQPIFEQEAPA